MSDHITAVGKAATQAGGFDSNMMTSYHRSDGKGWNSGEGETAGFPASKLRSILIPPKDARAKAAIDAAQGYLNEISKAVGSDEPSVQTANNQLALVKKTDGAGMNLADFGIFLVQIMHQPTQAMARAHDQTKPGGRHPRLRGPHMPETGADEDVAETPTAATPALVPDARRFQGSPAGSPLAVAAGGPAPAAAPAAASAPTGAAAPAPAAQG